MAPANGGNPNVATDDIIVLWGRSPEEYPMQPNNSEITFDVHLQPGEALSLPSDVTSSVGPGHWLISIRPADESADANPIRNHAAFLNSYVPEDEGLYDDYPAG
jgi:hypothetical protein